MTAAHWTPDELNRISRAEELEIAPQRRDGSLRRPLPIWVVRVGDDLFVRSWSHRKRERRPSSSCPTTGQPARDRQRLMVATRCQEPRVAT
jgi:hypothetical protein